MYGLSFSPEFFAAPNESESGELQLNSKGQPTTLLSAIRVLLSKPSLERRRLCLAFRASVATLLDNPWMIEERAREIDRCASIGRNGVPVYVTSVDNGWGLTVTVYEADQ